MSRSYKKEPYFKSIRQHSKHWSNKKVRHFKGDIADGYAYKKLYCFCDIYKQYSRLTLPEFISSCYTHRSQIPEETSEEYQHMIKLWHKCHRRK